jgi:hypothetical protein
MVMAICFFLKEAISSIIPGDLNSLGEINFITNQRVIVFYPSSFPGLVLISILELTYMPIQATIYRTWIDDSKPIFITTEICLLN